MPKTEALSEVDHGRVSERAPGAVVTSPAVRLLGPDATDEQWLNARRWRVGASELSAVVPGVHNPFTSPFKMWWSKQLAWMLDDDMALRIGRELEPVAGKLFAEERPDLLLCEPNGRLFGHKDRPWLCCTPDFLAVAVDWRVCPCVTAEGALDGCERCHGDGRSYRPSIEPVECKTDEGGSGWGKPGTDEIPDHHWYQLATQCDVFGASRGHLVRLAGKRLRCYTIEHDPGAEEWGRAVAAGRAFWASLNANEPPDVDGHTSTEEALSLLHPAVDDRIEYLPPLYEQEYDAARAAVAAAKFREGEVKNRIRAALGDARYGASPGGEPFVDRRVFKHPGSVIPPHPVDGLWPIGRNAHVKAPKAVD